jgi:DNA-binding transcriptional MerR regulator
LSSIVLPGIPSKRYFTIGEVSELCQVKPHVLRYWEQEFTQLKPVKRRGNRRYYQHHEVLLIRRIRELLYEEGFTINGARHRLLEAKPISVQDRPSGASSSSRSDAGLVGIASSLGLSSLSTVRELSLSAELRRELLEILKILRPNGKAV